MASNVIVSGGVTDCDTVVRVIRGGEYVVGARCRFGTCERVDAVDAYYFCVRGAAPNTQYRIRGSRSA